jgi:hypothetical protein
MCVCLSKYVNPGERGKIGDVRKSPICGLEEKNEVEKERKANVLLLVPASEKTL